MAESCPEEGSENNERILRIFFRAALRAACRRLPAGSIFMVFFPGDQGAGDAAQGPAVEIYIVGQPVFGGDLLCVDVFYDGGKNGDAGKTACGQASGRRCCL